MQNAPKNVIFSSFFIFVPIEITLTVDFRLVFVLFCVATACTNIFAFARMQFECNSVTKMTHLCTQKSQKFAILYDFRCWTGFQPTNQNLVFGIYLSQKSPTQKIQAKDGPIHTIASELNA